MTDILTDAKMALHETVHKYDDDNYVPDAIAAALIALVEVQQEILTELRKANTSGTVTAKMIRNGQTLFGTTPHEIADAPADSTKHPQQDKNTPHEDWPGHCGMEPDWPRDQPG